MEVSKLKSWVSMPSRESALPNSRVGQRGPVILLCICPAHQEECPGRSDDRQHPQYSVDDERGRSNGRTGRDQNDTEQLRDRRTAAACRTPARAAVI
jgi:hypothetical protein